MKAELEQPLLKGKRSQAKSSLYSQSSQSSHKSDRQESSLGFMAQTSLLIHKNLLLTFKNPKNLIFLILTPFLLSGFLFLFQELARNNAKRTRTDPPSFPI